VAPILGVGALVNVVELWRYPVKSLQGEQVDAVEVTTTGLAGDRAFALFDAETGFGLTARRVPELLFASARTRADGTVAITVPDGTVASDDDALSEWLGRRVTLRGRESGLERRFENPVDFEDEANTVWMPFDGAPGAFHDSARAQVSLVSTGTLGGWDRRRFRANVLLDDAGENELVGSDVALGDATLRLTTRIPRCVMTTRPQPDGIERDLDVLRTINREREGCLAVGALVLAPGSVRVGDALLPLG
jgi:MOSC domain-containing protein